MKFYVNTLPCFCIIINKQINNTLAPNFVTKKTTYIKIDKTHLIGFFLIRKQQNKNITTLTRGLTKDVYNTLHKVPQPLCCYWRILV